MSAQKSNARPELRVEVVLFRPRTELLYVGGSDRTALVEGMRKQVALVRAALADPPEVPVQGVLCFVDADWPVFGGSFTANDVAVQWPKKLKALLTEPGRLGQEHIADLQWRLHETFPQKKAPLAPWPAGDWGRRAQYWDSLEPSSGMRAVRAAHTRS